jgi:hypothetical protein
MHGVLAYMSYPSKRALMLATSYGLGRKLFQMYDAKMVDHKDIETPLLLSQKTAICTFGAAAAVYAWPYYLYIDASRLEIAMRKKKPEDYGYVKNFCLTQYFLE